MDIRGDGGGTGAGRRMERRMDGILFQRLSDHMKYRERWGADCKTRCHKGSTSQVLTQTNFEHIQQTYVWDVPAADGSPLQTARQTD
eukprot:scaffold291404_cov14-Prasinocladus_malaysianus.AAC.1